MGVNDRFANIAASGIQSVGKGLVTPQIRRPFDHPLPMTEGIRWPQLSQTLSQEDELRQQLHRLRRHYAPFLEEHAPAVPSFRQRTTFSQFQWRVLTDDDRQDFLAVLQGHGNWDSVTIPHYGGPLGKAETVYRTSFHQDELPDKTRAVFLHFDAVDYKAHVFLNGKLLGSHEGMFAPFEFDCTASLRRGENTLVICVENDFTLDGSRTEENEITYTGDKIYAASGPGYDDPTVGWHHCPPGMGIYQPVWLEIRPRYFLEELFARPICETQQLELRMGVYSCDIPEVPVSFRVSIFGKNFEETLLQDVDFHPVTSLVVGLGDTFTEALLRSQNMQDVPVQLKAGKGKNVFSTTLSLPHFRTWEPENPWLYEAQVQLLDETGCVIDVQCCTFGMRSFCQNLTGEKKGMFYLNGQPIRLRGANTMGFEQQDVMRGDLEQLVEDIFLAKACNMNFLRITQRPVQDTIYAYCDRLGLMVQTDLPVFGVMRRNQMAEALRQVGEMERLIRCHPACILVTYINEPFANANNMPHRNLDRQELMTFFDMADQMVLLENPDRVIKHVDGDYDPPSATLPDNHCYTTWYNGHGVDAGALHKGDWLPVKPGWYYGCGEFGTEGLDSVDLMRRRYPSHWLPASPEEEFSWSPNSIVGAQSGNFHYFFYETPHTLADWVKQSQDYQAEATKWMTEALRRNTDMVSFAIHLFIDAFPSGWMKTIVDCERIPKPAYFAYRDALTPTMVSLRTDRFSLFPGEQTQIEVWLCNDRPEALDGMLYYEANLPDGTSHGGSIGCHIAGNDVTYAGELCLPMPLCQGTLVVQCMLTDQSGTVLHRNNLTVQILDAEQSAGSIRVLGPKAVHLAQALDLVPDTNAGTLLLDGSCLDPALEDEVRRGVHLIVLELPSGSYCICDKTIRIKESCMTAMHFVSRDTDHDWVRGFAPTAFRHWYDPSLDRIAPILETTFVHSEITPVLTSGNTDENGCWAPAQAVGTFRYGAGRVTICQLKLDPFVSHNPIAARFANRMILGQ